MILNEMGQIYEYGTRVFTVGGIASVSAGTKRQQYGYILELDTESERCPTALCDFGKDDLRSLPLEYLTPLETEPPAAGKEMYVLYYLFDGSEGPRAKGMGISASKSVLLQLMLEDVKATQEDTQIILISAYADYKSDSLWFSYNSDDPPGPFYLCYNIEPVQIYSASKGGDGV